MSSAKPILKVYADADATYKSLRKKISTAKITSLIFVFCASVSVYLFFIKPNSSRGMLALGIFMAVIGLISAGLAWMTYHSIPRARKRHNDLPPLYSFYKDGFFMHGCGLRFSWEQVSRIERFKTNLVLYLKDVPNIREISFVDISRGIEPGILGMTFVDVSSASLSNIRVHIKAYAPDRLAREVDTNI